MIPKLFQLFNFLIRLLLDNGAEVNYSGGFKGWTPLYWSVRGNNPNLAALLLAHGANVDDISRTVFYDERFQKKLRARLAVYQS